MIAGALESLGQLMGAADTPLFAAEEAKKALIGLARDLRGLAYAFNTKISYMMLFDWMYPFVFNVSARVFPLCIYITDHIRASCIFF